MKLAQFEEYRTAQLRFVRRNKIMLVTLALVLLALVVWSGGGVTRQELRLMERVRSAQDVLYKWRTAGGSEFDSLADPHKTGLIGLEWSELSTTVGLLEAKRTACDPRWAVIIRRWMESLHVSEGDSVAIFTSSSFPGMALNAITALESLNVTPVLVVSLGSSVWGANDPLFPWPTIERKLRTEGFIRCKALFYTPGGNYETGGGLSEEARAIFRASANDVGVPLVIKQNLEEVISWKSSLLKEHKVKALISVGGSHANMGDDQTVLRLSPGLHKSGNGGDGVIGRALKDGYPVVHLLNIKGLSAEYGVPFDAAPGTLLYGKRTVGAAIVGVLIFTAVMYKFKRWSI